MAFYYKQIKQHKRGAKWDDGNPRMCTRCGSEGRRKRKQARYTAVLAHDASGYVLPVGYCAEHVPDSIKQSLTSR